MNKKLVSLLLSLAMVFSLAVPAMAAEDAATDKIVILHTNDVHCGIDPTADKEGNPTGVGYTGLAAYKADAEAAYGKDNVILVDCGDSIQGESIGSLTKGAALVDLMNQMGYAVATPGNHEFDYGVDNFAQLVKQAQFTYLCCNLTDLKGEPLFDAYKIVEVNGKKVAFVGIDTPETFFKSTPTYFQNEKGEYIYSFSEGNEGKDLYAAVQKAVDAARKEGADYVIALAHLGMDGSTAEWQSEAVIANTTGIDVMLDGHSHETYTKEVANKDGKEVTLQQTGTKLANIGQITIDVNTGDIDAKLIPAAEYTKQDETIDAAVKAVEKDFEAILNKVVAKTEVLLNVYDPDTGKRLIRNTETNLGDLVADAYLNIMGGDVAFINGGGIRADIAVGDVTYNQIIKVHPFGNEGCLAEVTGQQLLDALELGSANYPNESGGFLHVAGLSYTINASVPSSVELNDKGEFVKVAGARRVSDVVLDNGEAVDPTKTYKLACHNYYFHDGGDGFTMLKVDADKMLQDGGILDNEVLINYITEKLGGDVTAQAYGKPQGRIVIVPADVSTDAWYYEATKSILKTGLMIGTDKGFEGETALTRASVLQTLYRLEGTPAVETTGDEWYAKAVAWAKSAGLVGNDFAEGAADRQFAMDTLKAYCDAEKVAFDGLFIGNENGDLMAEKDFTRAEYAQVLLRLDAKKAA